MEKRDSLKVVDLFCGAGGLSLGFAHAGFDIVLGIDNDKDSLETFKTNFKQAKAVNINLFKFDENEIRKNLSGENIDVVVGGPPCQGFSLTGPRKFDDPRNKLYLSFFEVLKSLKPKAFVIENVPGMGKLYEGKVREDIKRRADELGYNVASEILTAANFDVPQMRKRIFFVGVKKEFGEFSFPKPTRTADNYIGTEEAIGDLPAVDGEFLGVEESNYESPALTKYQKEMRIGSTKLLNHVAAKHTDHVKSVISKVPEGGNYKDLPKGIGGTRKFHVAWTRYHSKKPSTTIDTGHRNHFHYKYNRVPTVRENARLQSFDDSFVFTGPKTQQFKQVGNAVPPRLAFHIAKKLKEVISN